MASVVSSVRSCALALTSELQSRLLTYRPRWQQTMLRIQTEADVSFLTKHFDFTIVDRYDFPEWKFSLLFLATLPPGEVVPGPPGSNEAHNWLWTTDLTTLELTLNEPSPEGPEKYISGNVEPHRGFGHIAVNVDDVYATCSRLEEAGVGFQKKPDEGRMKGLAFALLPSGYWLEIIKRGELHPSVAKPCSIGSNFSQTMIRVKDPKVSLQFYQEVFGMTLLCTRHFSDFSLFFLASLSPEEAAAVPQFASDDEAMQFVKTLHNPVLELTHNHGTESNPDFHYISGNDTGLRGFGHTGFLVDDLNAACADYEAAGIQFKKRPTDGNMKNIAFVYDPDGYWVEVIQRAAVF